MCFPSIPVLCRSVHLSPGLPSCFGSLLFYCVLPSCFWPASLSCSLWGPRQGCNTVIVRLFSEVVSNETPSPSSYLFVQPLHSSPFFSSYLLLILSCHLISIILLRHRSWNTSILLTSPSFIFHVLQPYMRTGLTNVLYSLIFILLDTLWNSILDLVSQTLLSLSLA